MPSPLMHAHESGLITPLDATCGRAGRGGGHAEPASASRVGDGNARLVAAAALVPDRMAFRWLLSPPQLLQHPGTAAAAARAHLQHALVQLGEVEVRAAQRVHQRHLRAGRRRRRGAGLQ